MALTSYVPHVIILNSKVEANNIAELVALSKKAQISIATSGEVARAYDAQCTPDFFGFNMKDELQYRGRLDASRTTLVANARRDLFEAMKQVAETGHGPEQQVSSMGCSIKWRH